LKNQTVQPDRIVLWIGWDDMQRLKHVCPQSSLAGVEVEGCQDFGSFNKLVHTLQKFPDAFVVSADDDLYYSSTWLETLVSGYDTENPSIVCSRAHRIRFDAEGGLRPYRQWEWDVQDEASRMPCADILPTGMAGTLYPPQCLHPDVARSDLFLVLCPTGDDLWFYWMAYRQRTLVRKVGLVFPHQYLPRSQDASLWATNIIDNDVQLRALCSEFGMPTCSPKKVGVVD